MKRLIVLATAAAMLAPILIRAQKATKQLPSHGKWLARSEKSQIDDSEIVTLAVTATGPVTGWLKKKTPTLLIRCKERKLDAFIDVGMPSNIERGELGMHHVRLRFDTTPAVTQVWAESTDHEALFAAGSSRSLVAKLQGTKTLVFEFTPFRASPAVVTFNVDGFREDAPLVLKGCAAQKKK